MASGDNIGSESLDQLVFARVGAYGASCGTDFPEIEVLVADVAEVHRVPVLVAVLKAEIDARWRLNRSLSIDSYLARFPELGADPGIEDDLRLADYIASRKYGVPLEGPAVLAKGVETRKDPEVRLEFRALPTVAGPCAPDAADVVGQESPHPAEALRSGQFPVSMGRYQILRMLGKGGMGAVYLAEDTTLRRPIALKVTTCQGENSGTTIARFRREAQAAASFRHPNICPIYDIGEWRGISFLTMAYIAGKPLHHYLADREPTMPEIARLVAKIGRALHVAHSAGVVHRDLKPANIMMDDRGEPVIMDFGLALLRDHREDRLTSPGMWVGTPEYMAPEQWSDDREKLGAHSDVYSLGVILYQLLTGQVPFPGDPPNILRRIATESPTPPTQLRPDVDPRLSDICLRALARDIHDRYWTAAELAAALEGAESSIPRVDTKPVAPARTRRVSRAWPAVAALALLLLIATVSLFRIPPENVVSAGLDPRMARARPEANNVHSANQDISAEPRVAASLAPNEETSATDDDSPLEILVQRKGTDGVYTHLGTRSGPLRPGDKIRIHVTLRAPTFVYLFWYDHAGRTIPLWPESLLTQGKTQTLWSPPLRPGEGEQDWHVVGGSPGTEMILMATRDEPLGESAFAEFASHAPRLDAKTSVVLFAKSKQKSPKWRVTRAPVAITSAPLGRLAMIDERFEHQLDTFFDAYRGCVFPFASDSNP